MLTHLFTLCRVGIIPCPETSARVFNFYALPLNIFTKMSEREKARLDEAMTNMINELDRSFLRDLQSKMFRCAAECADDKEASMQSVQKCIDICHRPLLRAQQYIESEMSNFQDRVQRCVMGCNDTIRDKMGEQASDSDIAKYTKEFEKCAKKCIDFHIDVIPNTLKQMKYKLKNQTQ